MKRHEQLQPLSRQHHNGLLAALLLSKGIKKNASTFLMRDFIIYTWQTDLEKHFSDEENFLLPAIKHTAIYDTLGQQLLQEHEVIRSLVHSFRKNEVSHDDIQKFADLLEAHIRFEERVLFPKTEELLSEAEMNAFGAHLHRGDEHNCMNYFIKFWE